MEAVPTLQRIHDHGVKGLICASAGNTARAFSHFCGMDGTPLIVVVGKEHEDRLWARPENDAESVHLVVVEDGDYYDAKTVAKQIGAELDGWQMEGVFTTLLEEMVLGVLLSMLHLPLGNYQTTISKASVVAIGPIGIHEMAQRLVDEGIFDDPFLCNTSHKM